MKGISGCPKVLFPAKRFEKAINRKRCHAFICLFSSEKNGMRHANAVAHFLVQGGWRRRYPRFCDVVHRCASVQTNAPTTELLLQCERQRWSAQLLKEVK